MIDISIDIGLLVSFCFLKARFQVPVRFWPLDPVTAKSLSAILA